MKWRDLNINAKIRSALGFVLVLAFLMGAYTMFNLIRVNRNISKLTDQYIPYVDGAIKTSQSWWKLSEYIRSYDFTANDYFLYRSENEFEVFNGALEGLIEMDGNLGEESNSEALVLLKESIQRYRSHLNTHFALQGQVSESRKALEEIGSKLYTAINANRYNGSVQTAGALAMGIWGSLQADEINRYSVNMQSKLDDLATLRNMIRNNSYPGNVSGLLRDFVNAAETYIDDYTVARKSEIIAFEMAKEIMWDIRTVSDLGQEQMKVVGSNSITVVTNVRNLIIVGVIFMVIIGLIAFIFLPPSITRPILEGVRGAEQIAEGDLTVSFDTTRKDEVGRLAAALNNMVVNLRELINDIAISARALDEAGDVLVERSEEMAAGAAEQASATEEVSSSMEEMYANIQQTADNARTTESIAKMASVSMNGSNKTSRVATANMEEITQKVSVISDIAFQTNILALNAAVEAARAGVEGRGFAVVAAEVRKLAERSQAAAAEINAMAGTTYASSVNALEQLEQLTPEIEKTASLIQEITVASMEQETGVEQINNALQQLNTVTQRNASTSEDINNAAHRLEELSDKLTKTLVKFKLDNEQV